jgi:hypothetical protein
MALSRLRRVDRRMRPGTFLPPHRITRAGAPDYGEPWPAIPHTRGQRVVTGNDALADGLVQIEPGYRGEGAVAPAAVTGG